jgi:hypothetical protein
MEITQKTLRAVPNGPDNEGTATMITENNKSGVFVAMRKIPLAVIRPFVLLLKESRHPLCRGVAFNTSCHALPGWLAQCAGLARSNGFESVIDTAVKTGTGIHTLEACAELGFDMMTVDVFGKDRDSMLRTLELVKKHGPNTRFLASVVHTRIDDNRCRRHHGLCKPDTMRHLAAEAVNTGFDGFWVTSLPELHAVLRVSPDDKTIIVAHVEPTKWIEEHPDKERAGKVVDMSKAVEMGGRRISVAVGKPIVGHTTNFVDEQNTLICDGFGSLLFPKH